MTSMAEVWGRMALRIANAEHYPHDFALYADRVRTFVDDLARKSGVNDQLDLREARAACDAWSAAAASLEHALSTTLAEPVSPARAAHLAAINEAMRSVEQTLLNVDGIPGRPWFRHVLYAPRETYAAMTLPGVQEAIEAGDWNRGRAQLAIVTARINAAAQLTSHASAR